MRFWPSGWAENLTFWGTVVVVALLAAWVLGNVGFPKWPASTALDHVGWERDRVLSVAKGTATGAVGFLTAVLVALLKNEIKANVPAVAVLGCLLGAVGLLLFAARMSVSVRVTEATGSRCDDRRPDDLPRARRHRGGHLRGGRRSLAAPQLAVAVAEPGWAPTETGETA